MMSRIAVETGRIDAFAPTGTCCLVISQAIPKSLQRLHVRRQKPRVSRQ